MANVNIDEIVLGPIDLLVDGERANADNLNRPLIQLRDNQNLQNNMLDQIYGVLGSDDIDLDSLQEIGNSIDSLKDSVASLEEGGLSTSAGEVLELLGGLSVAETLEVTGLSSLNGGLNVVGDSTFDGDISTTGTISSDGNISTGGNIYATNGYFSSNAYIDNDEIATKNWVLSNVSGGAGGATEITKIFNFTGDGSKTDYDVSFVKSSISIYIDGILIEQSDYSLWYDDGEGVVSSGDNGVEVRFEDAPNSNSSITVVAYGGADVYTKTETYTKEEVDDLVDGATAADTYTKSEIDSLADNYYTKTETDEKIEALSRIDKLMEMEDITSMLYEGGNNSDKLSTINFTNSYSQELTYDSNDRITYIDYLESGSKVSYTENTYDANGNLYSVTYNNTPRT